MNRLVRVVALLGLLPGCASMSVQSVPDDLADAEETGFRYYEASPYVLVCTDNKGSLTSRLIYLPDLTKKRAVSITNRLASSETTLTFKDGVLTSAAHTVDQTTVPVEIIKAVEKVAVSGAARMAKAPAEGPVNNVAAPYLFKVVCENGTWSLIGCQATDANGKTVKIKVTVGKVDAKSTPAPAKTPTDASSTE